MQIADDRMYRNSEWSEETRHCPVDGPGWPQYSCTVRGEPSSGAEAHWSGPGTFSPPRIAPGTTDKCREFLSRCRPPPLNPRCLIFTILFLIIIVFVIFPPIWSIIVLFFIFFFFYLSFNARQFTVRLGDVDLRRDDEPSSPETYYVVEVRGHHKFSRVGFYNDIAILVLDRPVKRSKYVIPLCLPPKTSRSDTFVGQSPTVVGWGTTYYGKQWSGVRKCTVWARAFRDDILYYIEWLLQWLCISYNILCCSLLQAVKRAPCRDKSIYRCGTTTTATELTSNRSTTISFARGWKKEGKTRVR